MSKVICDVCGTSFPETATNCPICGCAKAPTAQPVADEEMQQDLEGTTAYNYVKGGRFSKSNVKRTAGGKTPERRRPNDRGSQNEPQENNKALIAVVVILLLAIIMVVVYIGVKVFLTDLTDTPNNETTQSTHADSGSTGPDSNEQIPCTELKLGSMTIEFDAENEQYMLSVELTPADTTDAVTFMSADPTIATVDENGVVRPVGYGTTVITVTCGAQTKECNVISTVGVPPTTVPPTQPAPTAPAGFVLKLMTYKDSGEITISKEGAVTPIYKETNGVKASDITWTTADPAIATVEDGKVIGVDRGVVLITATIGNQTATCKVICAFDAAEPTEPAPYTISHSDVTISKGESFSLSLKNADGAKAQNVEWTADKEGIVEIDGGKITGGEVSKLTKVVVSAEYEDYTYSCIVYVKAGE